MGVILDSPAIISAERAGETPFALLQRVASVVGEEQPALTAIGYTELIHGTYRALSRDHRSMSSAFLADLAAVLPIYPFTRERAEIAGRIDAEQRLLGFTIPYADLLIGATALSLNFAVLTANQRHFRLIPNLRVIPF